MLTRAWPWMHRPPARIPTELRSPCPPNPMPLVPDRVGLRAAHVERGGERLARVRDARQVTCRSPGFLTRCIQRARYPLEISNDVAWQRFRVWAAHAEHLDAWKHLIKCSAMHRPADTCASCSRPVTEGDHDRQLKPDQARHCPICGSELIRTCERIDGSRAFRCSGVTSWRLQRLSCSEPASAG